MRVETRGSNRSRLSAFVQISALFQIYITDMSRHLHHLTNCPFEVKKGGLKGLFLYWEVILLIFFVFFCCKKVLFLAGKGLCYVVVTRFCRDMTFVGRIYALFWSGFEADFYADIEDFVQISARKNARWKLWHVQLCKRQKLQTHVWAGGIQYTQPCQNS